MNTIRALTIITAAITVALSSCTSSPKAAMKNTITQRQAIERTEEYVRQAVSTLLPTPQLDLLSRFEDSPCDDPTDNGPKGRVITSVRYWLNDTPVDRQADYVKALIRWWSEHDFAILTDNRPNDTYVLVENRRDGFRMAMQQTATGPKRLSLGASSPCVWPNGTPEPKP